MRFEVGVVGCPDGVDIFDIQTGTLLRSISIQAVSGVFASLGEEHVIVSQANKGGIAILSWKTGATQLRCAVPEVLQVLQVSRDQCYLVGGAASGKVYVWALDSGNLMQSWPAHYKGVSALCFTTDDSYLLTGGEDGMVNVWSFDESLFQPAAAYPVATQEWAHHTLPVTAIFAGVGGAAGRIVSASLDRTCRIYSLPANTLLNTILFPSFVTCLAVDPAETLLVAGCGNGQLFKTAFAERASSGATGLADGETSLVEFVGHSKEVTALSFSFNGGTLLSAAKDGHANVWSVSSAQLLRSLTKNRDAYVSAQVLRDPNAFLGRSVQPTVSNKAKVNFVHLRNQPEAKQHVVQIRMRGCELLGEENSTKKRSRFAEEEGGEELPSADNSGPSLAGRLQGEIEKSAELTQELDRWKAMSQHLHLLVVENVRQDLIAPQQEKNDNNSNNSSNNKSNTNNSSKKKSKKMIT